MTTTEDFQTRVQRIQKARTKPSTTVFVGMDESYVVPRGEAARPKKGPAKALRPARPRRRGGLLAVLLGCLAFAGYLLLRQAG